MLKPLLQVDIDNNMHCYMIMLHVQIISLAEDRKTSSRRKKLLNFPRLLDLVATRVAEL